MGVLLKYLFALGIVILVVWLFVKSIQSLIGAIRARIKAKKSPDKVFDDKPAGDVDTDDRKGGANE